MYAMDGDVGWAEERISGRAAAHRRTALSESTRESALESLRQKCVARVRKRRRKILNAMRRRNAAAGRGNFPETPVQSDGNDESENARFLAGTIRQLVRRELSAAALSSSSSSSPSSSSLSSSSSASSSASSLTDDVSSGAIPHSFSASTISGAKRSRTGSPERALAPVLSSPPTPSSPGLAPLLGAADGGGAAASPSSSSLDFGFGRGNGKQDVVGGGEYDEDMMDWGGEARAENDGGDDYDDYDDDLSGIDLDWMLAMEEEIMRTLEVEEQAILAEFYAHDQAETVAATDDVMREQQYQDHLAHVGGDESQVVLCPVCQSNYLFARRSVIFCSCGEMRVDSQGDCIELPHLQEALAMTHSSHAQRGCGGGKLVFSCTQMFGSSTCLQAECKACGFLQVVI